MLRRILASFGNSRIQLTDPRPGLGIRVNRQHAVTMWTSSTDRGFRELETTIMDIDTSERSVRKAGRTISPVRPAVGRNQGPLDLRLAATPSERDAVFRFRHRILGRRLGEDLGFTCRNGRLLESFDVGTDLLAAFGGGERVHAVIRIEEFQAARIRRGFPVVAMEGDRGSEIEPASFSSRLLVDPEAAAHLTVRLLASLVGIAVRRGFHREFLIYYY